MVTAILLCELPSNTRLLCDNYCAAATLDSALYSSRTRIADSVTVICHAHAYNSGMRTLRNYGSRLDVNHEEG